VDDYGTYITTVPPSDAALATWLEDAKSELDITEDTENSRIMRLIRTAVEQVESDARRVVMLQTMQWHADDFPCGEIELRRVPVATVPHIKYYAATVFTTLSPTLYHTDLTSEPARIRPVSGQYWPATDCRMKAVQVEFTCGYATAALVPDYLKHVILTTVRGLYYGCELGEGYWAMIQRLRRFGTIE